MRKPVPEQWRYWQEKLGPVLPVLTFPVDNPRPPVPSFIRSTEDLDLGAALSGDLQSFCEAHRLSLFPVMLAGLTMLLSRYTGEDDIVVGSASVDSAEGADPGRGTFVNPVLLRTSLAGKPSVTELLQRAGRTVTEAAANRDCPFDQIVESLSPPSASGEPQPIPVMLFLIGIPAGVSAVACSEGDLTAIGSLTVQSDLVVTLRQEESGLRLRFEYDLDVLAVASIKRMMRHLRDLLVALIEDPGRSCETVPMIGDQETALLMAWSGSGAERLPAGRCIQDIFEERARQTPDFVAVAAGDQHLTYAGLARLSDRLAGRLSRRGLKPDETVGLCLDRSLDAVVSFLGVLKAGGAYLPLDPSHPEERLADLVTRSGTRIVLREPDLHADLHGDAPEALQATAPALDEAEGEPRARSHPDNLAYVMYTSGTEGLPKGVAVTHRNVVRLALGLRSVWPPGDEVVLHAANEAFDASTFEIWATLLNGGRVEVHVARDISPGDLAHAVERCRVTTLWLSTGLFHQLSDGDLKYLTDLRHVFTGGEVLSPRQVRRVAARLPGCGLIHCYGPTENTTFTSCHLIRDSDLLGAPFPISGPISNTTMYVIDRQGRVTPIGLPGELLTGGDGLARGYAGRPDLTAERFIPNPFSSEPGARLYRTGDLVRYRSNGELEFLGRLDRQIKIRGFRVEPAEIEKVLRTHPAVKDALVMIDRGDAARNRLVAYFIALGGSEAPARSNDLRAFLEARLPAYMVPVFFVGLDAFPMTPNGKVDHRSLPLPDLRRPEDAWEFVPPRDELEEAISRVWTEVLGIEEFGIHDEFFGLGGHSLLAAQVFNRLQQIFGIEMPQRAIFEATTIEAQARTIRNAGGGQGRPDRAPGSLDP